jgi:hypothetical protein
MAYLAHRSRASREFVSAFGREPEAGDVLCKDDLTSDGKDGIGELQGVPEIPRDRAFRWATIAAEALGTGAGNFHRLCTEPPFTAVVFLGAIGPVERSGGFTFGPKHLCRPSRSAYASYQSTCASTPQS